MHHDEVLVPKQPAKCNYSMTYVFLFKLLPNYQTHRVFPYYTNMPFRHVHSLLNKVNEALTRETARVKSQA